MMDAAAASMHPTARPCFVRVLSPFAVALALVTTGAPVADASAGARRLRDAPSRIARAPITSQANVTQVHVRGFARIDAHVARSQGKLVVMGTVTDDVGNPMPGARVAVQIALAPADRSADHEKAKEGLPIPGPAPLLPFDGLAPEMCTDVAQAPVLEGPDRLLMPTVSSGGGKRWGTGGRFCLRVALPLGRYVVRLEARTLGLIEAAQIDLPADLALEPVTLRFDPDPSVVYIDEGAVPVRVVASTESDGIASPAASLPLELLNESGAVLGNAVTNDAGRALFNVDGAHAGPPGKGELRVVFGGNSREGNCSHAFPVERRTHVDVHLPDATAGRLPIASSDSRVKLHVVANATCSARGCVGTPTGSVQVRLANEGCSAADARPIGAAMLRDGEAFVVATLPTMPEPRTAGTEVAMMVCYVPDAPWFLPAVSPPLAQPLRPPSRWNVIGLAGAGLFVLAWLGIGRLWPSPRATVRATTLIPALSLREGTEGVEVLNATATAAGWTGRVVDAHDGRTVVGARVAIERPGFERAEVLVDAPSDHGGRFVLAGVEVRSGDVLVAEAPWHTAMRVPVPARGALRVSLVARRRALLDRLVAWARRAGRPFDASPEPTPGHVRRSARTSFVPEATGDVALGSPGALGGKVGVWAEAVERAAYGGEPVDAQREAEVDALAPVAATERGGRLR